MIMSDTWNRYSFFDENFFPQPYLPDSVNQPTNFIGPETGAIKTDESTKFKISC